MQQLKDDEDRWERHRVAQLQEQEDRLMAEALAGKSLKRKGWQDPWNELPGGPGCSG